MFPTARCLYLMDTYVANVTEYHLISVFTFRLLPTHKQTQCLTVSSSSWGNKSAFTANFNSSPSVSWQWNANHHYHQQQDYYVNVNHTQHQVRNVELHQRSVAQMSLIIHETWCDSATGRVLDLRSAGRGFKSYSRQRCITTLGKLFTSMCLCRQAV